MRHRPLFLQFAVFAAPSLIAFWGESWSMALALSALMGLAGLALQRRLGCPGGVDASFYATLVVILAAPGWGTAGAPDLARCLQFFGSSLFYCWLAAPPSDGGFRVVLSAAFAILPTTVELARASTWDIRAENLLAGLFGAVGLLYNSPLLWVGFLFVFALRRTEPGLSRLCSAGIVPGTLCLLLSTDRADTASRAVTWLPLLLPGTALGFAKIRDSVAHSPKRALVWAGALLVLWNLLFMEQYRRLLVPSDQTVSFAQVSSNAAALLSQSVGAPTAWPANWIFSHRFAAPPDRWESAASLDFFPNAGARFATIEIGDDASVFATDATLLLEGFGMRRTCEQGWCRDLDGAGRLLLPLRDVGAGDLVLRLRVRGRGTLSFSLNGERTLVSELTESLSELTLRVPSGMTATGINIVQLSVVGGGRATVDRLTLERDAASGSAR